MRLERIWRVIEEDRCKGQEGREDLGFEASRVMPPRRSYTSCDMLSTQGECDWGSKMETWYLGG